LASRPTYSLAQVALACGLGAGLCCVGCGRKDVRVPTFATQGRVIAADGTPVSHALVVLHPLENTASAPRSRGTTDSEGQFQLTTYDTHDGAPAGQFAVTVEQWIRDDPNLPPRNHLPISFAKTESSGIRISIAPTENQLGPIQIR